MTSHLMRSYWQQPDPAAAAAADPLDSEAFCSAMIEPLECGTLNSAAAAINGHHPHSLRARYEPESVLHLSTTSGGDPVAPMIHHQLFGRADDVDDSPAATTIRDECAGFQQQHQQQHQRRQSSLMCDSLDRLGESCELTTAADLIRPLQRQSSTDSGYHNESLVGSGDHSAATSSTGELSGAGGYLMQPSPPSAGCDGLSRAASNTSADSNSNNYEPDCYQSSGVEHYPAEHHLDSFHQPADQWQCHSSVTMIPPPPQQQQQQQHFAHHEQHHQQPSLHFGSHSANSDPTRSNSCSSLQPLAGSDYNSGMTIDEHRRAESRLQTPQPDVSQHQAAGDAYLGVLTRPLGTGHIQLHEQQQQHHQHHHHRYQSDHQAHAMAFVGEQQTDTDADRAAALDPNATGQCEPMQYEDQCELGFADEQQQQQRRQLLQHQHDERQQDYFSVADYLEPPTVAPPCGGSASTIKSHQSKSAGGPIMANFNKLDRGGQLIEYQPAYETPADRYLDASADASFAASHQPYQMDYIQQQHQSGTSFYSGPFQSTLDEQQQQHQFGHGDEFGASGGHEATAYLNLDEPGKTYHLFGGVGQEATCADSSDYLAHRYEPQCMQQQHHHHQLLHEIEHQQPPTSSCYSSADEPLAAPGERGSVVYYSLDRASFAAPTQTMPTVSRNYDPTAEISSCLAANASQLEESSPSGAAIDDDDDDGDADEDEDCGDDDDHDDEHGPDGGELLASGRGSRRRPVPRRRAATSAAASARCQRKSTQQQQQGHGSSGGQQTAERPACCSADTRAKLRLFLLKRARTRESARAAKHGGDQHAAASGHSNSRPIKTVKADTIPYHRAGNFSETPNSSAGSGSGSNLSSGPGSQSIGASCSLVTPYGGTSASPSGSSILATVEPGQSLPPSYPSPPSQTPPPSLTLSDKSPSSSSSARSCIQRQQQSKLAQASAVLMPDTKDWGNKSNGANSAAGHQAAAPKQQQQSVITGSRKLRNRIVVLDRLDSGNINHQDDESSHQSQSSEAPNSSGSLSGADSSQEESAADSMSSSSSSSSSSLTGVQTRASKRRRHAEQPADERQNCAAAAAASLAAAAASSSSSSSSSSASSSLIRGHPTNGCAEGATPFGGGGPKFRRRSLK